MSLKPVKSVAQVMLYLIYFSIVFEAASSLLVILSLFHISLPATSAFTGFFSVFSSLFTIANFVLQIIYAYRFSCNNQIYCDNKNIEFRPGWTVGVFFIPILNLFKPYYALKEFIYNLSVVEYEEKKAIADTLCKWWLLHIFGSLGIAILGGINVYVPGISIIGSLIQVAIFYYQIKFIRDSSIVQEKQIELVDSYGVQN
jgi:hypothetical protein